MCTLPQEGGTAVGTPAAFRVLISRLSGDTLELEAEPADVRLVQDLKRQIAEQWGIPPPCQRLLFNSQDLSDKDVLASALGQAMPAFTLVVLMEDAYADLSSGDENAKRAAAEALEQMAREGDDRAIDALVACLDDEHEDVRDAVVNALAQVAGQGSERVLWALRTQLDDPREAVRSIAVDTLARVALKGDSHAMPLLTAHLVRASGADDVKTMYEVSDALVRIAHADHHELATPLTPLIEHPTGLVRKVAVRAVARGIQEGDEQAVLALTSRLQAADEDLLIRRMACGALARVAKKGNERALAALRACAEDADGIVRQAAARV